MEKIDLYLQAMWEAVTFEFALKLGIIYFFVIWIALIVWVIKDISIRTNNLFFQIIAVLTILLLSPFGIFIYLLIRPRRTLYDKYYEEIEENLDIFNQIVEERKKGKFISIEDLQNRGKVNQTAIERLRALGVLKDLPESSQLSLF